MSLVLGLGLEPCVLDSTSGSHRVILKDICKLITRKRRLSFAFPLRVKCGSTCSCVIVVLHLYPPVTGQRQTLNCWKIRTLLNVISCLEEFPLVSVGFSKSYPLKFAACSKLPSKSNHREGSYCRKQGRRQGAG